MRRLIAFITSSVIALLVFAPAALAHDGGEGLLGETNDKITTVAGLCMVIFFPTVIVVANTVLGRLEKRKDARKAAAKARAKSAEWQRGW